MTLLKNLKKTKNEKLSIRVWIHGEQIDHQTHWQVRWRDFASGQEQYLDCGLGDQGEQLARAAVDAKRQDLLSMLTPNVMLNWLRWLELDKNVSPWTISTFKNVYDALTCSCSMHTIIKRFCAALIVQGHSSAMISWELYVLRASFDRAVQCGVMADNPLAGQMPEISGNPTDIGIGQHKFERLIHCCPSYHWRVICYLGMYAGLRIDEMLALRRCDVVVNPQSGHQASLNLVMGNNKVREVYIEPNDEQAVEELEQLISLRDRSALIFVDFVQGLYNPEEDLNRQFRKIWQEANLDDDGGSDKSVINALRKTYFCDGFSPEDIKEISGCRSIITAVMYYLPEMVAEELQEIDMESYDAIYKDLVDDGYISWPEQDRVVQAADAVPA